MADPWMVVGLGNPGAAYAATRHNVGAMAVEECARERGARLSRHKKAQAEVAESHFGVPGHAVRTVLCKPLSFMNLSGGPVKNAMDFYRVPLDRLIVLHDELDIEFGALKVKKGGGDGGHNGLKSIRSAIGSGDYLRVRLGIGRPPGSQAAADYVLQTFSSTQRSGVPQLVADACAAVESLMLRGLEETQNAYHGPPRTLLTDSDFDEK